MTLSADLDAAIHAGCQVLKKSLRCKLTTAKTHRTLLVEGWGSSSDTIGAVAAYLVGLLASAISHNLEVRASLEDTADDRLDLLRSVEVITGSSGATLSNDQKQDERNPWIAEGIWHLCLFLASQCPNLHPPGEVIAVDLPHVAAKDHGLDVVALYRSATTFGLTIVECKAYEKRPNEAINEAVTFFRMIDDGRHDTRIRQIVQSMRRSLAPQDQQMISPSLWKRERVYLPNPHYDATVVMDWLNTRSSFKGLKAQSTIIAPHAIHGFGQFFDDVACAMLSLAQGLNDV